MSRIFAILAASFAVAAALARAGGAQTGILPPECYSTSRHLELPVQPSSPERSNWLKIVSALLEPYSRFIDDTSAVSPVRDSLGALMRQDSAAVEWALAELATSPDVASRSTAISASHWYARYFGSARPILHFLQESGDDWYRSLALGAISRAPSAAEQGIIFAYACDAAWMLGTLRADRAYRRWAWDQGADLHWPFELRYLLDDAVRLLSGRQREIVQRLQSKVAM